MLNGKNMIILLTAGLIKKILLYKMSYFTESHAHSKNKIKVELGLPKCTRKSDLKNVGGVNTSNFAKKTWFRKLKIKYWWLSDVTEKY